MKLRCSLFAKAAAALMLALFSAGALLTTIVTVSLVSDYSIQYDSFFQTPQGGSALRDNAASIFEYKHLTEFSDRTEEQQERLETLRATLYPPLGSNAVWVLLDSQGQVLLTNLENAQGPQPSAEAIAERTNGNYLQIHDGGRYVIIGLREPLTVQDGYASMQSAYQTARAWTPLLITAFGLCALVCVVMFSFLVAAAGHNADCEGIRLSFFDKVWLEPLLAAYAVLVVLILASFDHFDFYLNTGLVYLLYLSTLVLFFTLLRRFKAHHMWRSTLLWFLVRMLRTAFRHLPVAAATAGALMVFSLLQDIFLLLIYENGGFILLWIMFQAAFVVLGCYTAVQLDRLHKATFRMTQGQLGRVISEGSVPFFRTLARNLNSTGSALTLAVEHAMQSERMKTDLIANVSHDIKTPLTSIISYVDLLKSRPNNDEKAREYLRVLDGKSRRLAQLMEDLVEASKVTTGNVSVNLEVINLSELVKQAGGEFESRLEQRGIQMVCTLPDLPVYVIADGRHMWRILDNLFSNAAKYALDGTRVYVDVQVIGRDVLLSVKNISRAPLNMPPSELMERFVRGDKSRHTEGSGLGLSIARSLIELQNGTMNIFIDGDLFKVVLLLRLTQPPAPPPFPVNSAEGPGKSSSANPSSAPVLSTAVPLSEILATQEAPPLPRPPDSLGK